MAAGKLVAERTRLAREARKKDAAEAAVIITNNKAKASAEAPAPTTEDASPSRSSLSTTQWFAAGSFAISQIGVYYKRDEFKAVFSKITAALARQLAPEHVNCNPVAEQQPAPATPASTAKKRHPSYGLNICPLFSFRNKILLCHTISGNKLVKLGP